MSPDVTTTTDNVIKRMEQENRVLKMEVETLKLRIKALIEENKSLRAASVSIQARAEQEEEFISNTLLKRIQVLKKEKETLALNYEQEEECLTNDLSRKLNQLRAEKVQLEKTLEHEQEALVNKLMRKIEKLEGETLQKQTNLEQLRREKIELENTLEQEQESLVNRLWKRMDKLENEKRNLQTKLEDYNKSIGVSPAPSPSPQPSHSSMSGMDTSNAGNNNNMADARQLSLGVNQLRCEVSRLKHQLVLAEKEHTDKMAKFEREEREQKEQNLRLQRKLQIEMERRETLCRHLSESESSLEMDEERQFNEHQLFPGTGSAPPAVEAAPSRRPRTLSSPVPPVIGAYGSASPHPAVSGRPLSPLPLVIAPHGPLTNCPSCNFTLPVPAFLPVPLPPPLTGTSSGTQKPKETKFMKHC
jgi:coiled-coil domain-containing protein 6